MTEKKSGEKNDLENSTDSPENSINSRKLIGDKKKIVKKEEVF